MKTFSENYNESLINICLQIYRESLSLVTFLGVHSNWKEVSCLSWQNTYPKSKTTCHIKLKFFFLTKLLENVLLAKYIIPVTSASKDLWYYFIEINKLMTYKGAPKLYFMRHSCVVIILLSTDLYNYTILYHFLPIPISFYF